MENVVDVSFVNFDIVVSLDGDSVVGGSVKSDIAIGETDGDAVDSKEEAVVDSVFLGSNVGDIFVDFIVDISVVTSVVVDSVVDDSVVEDSVVDFTVVDSAVVDSGAVRTWQTRPEKPSGQRQPSSPVLESRKQVAPFWQGL